MGGGACVESEEKKKERNRVGWTEHGVKDQDKARRPSGWVATGQHTDETQKTVLCF